MQLKFNKDSIFISIDFNVRVLSLYHWTFETIFWKIGSSKRKAWIWHFSGTWNRTKARMWEMQTSCFTIALCLSFCRTSYQTRKLIIYIWVVQYGRHYDLVDHYGISVSQKVTDTLFCCNHNPFLSSRMTLHNFNKQK